MGKRSGKTKSGRVMNPADRERKKQRAQELKRNKKQRNIVRQAIVKARNPDDLLEQLRRLDNQEFDPKCELSKYVIVEKRTKTMGAFIQQLALYRQENDANQVTRLENLLHEYENDRLRKEQQHRAVIVSNEVNVGDIPLPSGFMMPNAAMTPFTMPAPPQPPQKSRSGILKPSKPTSSKVHKDPPGPPCGFPPTFDVDKTVNRSHRVQFSDYREQNYDSYDEVEDDDLAPVAIPDSLLPPKSSFQPVRPLISAPPLPPSMAPPPPPKAPMYQRYNDMQHRPQIPALNTTMSAPPEISRSASATFATISAEPQMRNLKKEATRFIPTALHVSRPDISRPKPITANTTTSRVLNKAKPIASKTGKTADEACEDFLKEIQDLL